LLENLLFSLSEKIKLFVLFLAKKNISTVFVYVHFTEHTPEVEDLLAALSKKSTFLFVELCSNG